MDILNWLYSVKKKFARTSVENPDKDLIALGADVSYTKRGDKYQTYVVPFGSAVAELEGDVLRTGIYDNFPFPVGWPVMTKTTTKVIDTPASPTFVALDLQGWKISGTLDITTGFAADSYYIGTVDFTNDFFPIFPWKTTGTVFCYDDNDNEAVYTSLGNGAFLWDANNFQTAKADFYFTVAEYPGSVDIYLVYRGTSPADELYGTVSFQYEFLHPASQTPTFSYY